MNSVPIYVFRIQEQREERHALKRARGETVDDSDLLPASIRGNPYEYDIGGSFPKGEWLLIVCKCLSIAFIVKE